MIILQRCYWQCAVTSLTAGINYWFHRGAIQSDPHPPPQAISCSSPPAAPLQLHCPFSSWNLPMPVPTLGSAHSATCLESSALYWVLFCWLLLSPGSTRLFICICHTHHLYPSPIMITCTPCGFWVCYVCLFTPAHLLRQLPSLIPFPSPTLPWAAISTFQRQPSFNFFCSYKNSFFFLEPLKSIVNTKTFQEDGKFTAL